MTFKGQPRFSKRNVG